MSKNYMTEVAKLLGVELEEDFRIKGICADLLFRITEGGVLSHYPRSEYGELNKLMLAQLLTGDSEIIRLPWKPAMYDDYYFPLPSDNDLWGGSIWTGSDSDISKLKRGLVFKTIGEAVAATEKMLAVVKEENNG